MSKKKSTRPVKAAPIELCARLCIADAVALHRLFTERIAQCAPIVVDGRNVKEIDTAILQVLVSLWLTGAKRGVECRWLAVSAALQDSAKLIGVADLLSFDTDKTAYEHAVV